MHAYIQQKQSMHRNFSSFCILHGDRDLPARVESKNKIPFRGKACLKDQNKFCLSLRKILENTRRIKKNGNKNRKHLARSSNDG